MRALAVLFLWPTGEMKSPAFHLTPGQTVQNITEHHEPVSAVVRISRWETVVACVWTTSPGLACSVSVKQVQTSEEVEEEM